MRDQELPLPVVWLHHLEFRNALRLRVFRREISPLQWDASLRAMLADLAGGALIQAAPALADLVTLKLSEDQPDPARGGTPRLQWTRRPRRVPLPARFRTA
jgi:hypothetical protein